MKELKELGFEYMSTLNEFVCRVDNGLSLKRSNHVYLAESFCMVRDYKNLIDQQPKLGDFIPCIDGVPVYKPKLGMSRIKDMIDQYQQALEQVKFEGWELIEKDSLDKIIVKSTEHQKIMFNSSGLAFKCWFTTQRNRYKTYEQAINDGVKFKIK